MNFRDMNFRENLRFVLDSKGILIKELSARTKISENTIKSYLRENGAEPTLSKALAIAKALGVSLEFLAIGNETNNKIAETSISHNQVINPKIIEIETLLPECTQKQLSAILLVEKEFLKK